MNRIDRIKILYIQLILSDVFKFRVQESGARKNYPQLPQLPQIRYSGHGKV